MLQLRAGWMEGAPNVKKALTEHSLLKDESQSSMTRIPVEMIGELHGEEQRSSGLLYQGDLGLSLRHQFRLPSGSPKVLRVEESQVAMVSVVHVPSP